ncbi:acyl carrier protein [Streptomyces tagetis]|uniref:Acyl carrier protein n=1 Tax=Streptomyces tagetis TaxID=2820809 RepID=A0A940XDT3_9ACTN|nr:acyl carrier protein [Streptomyces sp. RG38]MBQ0826575.1 acyl carrier protein [Streptomyces sp. RG38]
MTHDVFAVVDELFRTRLHVPRPDPDTPLLDYGLDSVRSLDLIVELEHRFDVRISDEQAAAMLTLRDVAAQVSASLAAREGDGNRREGDAEPTGHPAHAERAERAG